MKFLIDECLSPELVGVANVFGYEAHHVTRRGWQGQKDHQILNRLLSQELILVTNNRDDFIDVLGGVELHPGLIVIVDNVRRADQLRLFGLALNEIRDRPSLINTVVEVNASGRVEVYELPAL